jgi:hypothetical protein
MGVAWINKSAWTQKLRQVFSFLSGMIAAGAAGNVRAAMADLEMWFG